MPTDLFAPHADTILVLGVGSLGGRIASLGALGADSASSITWGAAHANAPELIATGLERKLLIQAEGPFAATRARHLVTEQRPVLRLWTMGKSVVLLVGAAGERAVAALLPALAESFSRQHIFVGAVLTGDCSAAHTPDRPPLIDMPKLQEHCDLAVMLPPELVSAALPVESTISAWHAAHEKRVLSIVETLAGALTSESDGNAFDADTLRRLRGGVPAVGFGYATGANCLQTALETALQAIRGSSEPLGQLAVSIQAGWALTLAELRAISGKLDDVALPRPASLAFSHHPQMTSEAACLILGTAPVRAKVVHLDAARPLALQS